ncbi:lysophospholipase [Sporolactobacillus terrae]|uniref:Lysophospholipase n=1 Tax=Sporolactobacillus terrae TaxID=269673 RepID=A0ABX5Q607_9BACL|nr:lysophospholipase [Sporolactobacillus terrae]QAA25048.1 lysophospholipase [Sporolactobacillus terrae]UAK16871.1 lysophospholipase [Sporolactobacillus terrae]
METFSIGGDDLRAEPLYTALGDSLTVGVGSTVFQPNFVKLYQRKLEVYYHIKLQRQIFAKNGATTEQILQSTFRPEIAAAIGRSTFLTITGGGNDFLKAGRYWMKTGDFSAVLQATENSLAHMEQMIYRIHLLHEDSTDSYRVRILNLYNPLFYIPGTNHWLEDYNKRLNQFEDDAHVRIADVYHAFSGYEPQLLGFDHLHPNPIGYRVMAEVTPV